MWRGAGVWLPWPPTGLTEWYVKERMRLGDANARKAKGMGSTQREAAPLIQITPMQIWGRNSPRSHMTTTPQAGDGLGCPPYVTLTRLHVRGETQEPQPCALVSVEYDRGMSFSRRPTPSLALEASDVSPSPLRKAPRRYRMPTYRFFVANRCLGRFIDSIVGLSTHVRPGKRRESRK